MDNEMSGYADPVYKYGITHLHLIRRIGAGISCKVFEAKLNHQHVVAKMFTSQQLFDLECDVWKKIQEKGSCQYLCEMMGRCTETVRGIPAGIIVFQPILRHIAREDLFLFADQLFDALKQFNKIGLIHRDITPRHLMQDPKTKKLVICDLGFALVLENNSQEIYVDFAGSNEFAPARVLLEQKLVKSAHIMYTPSMRDDVESAVKMILCVIRPDLEQKLKRMVKNQQFDAVEKLWREIETTSQLWQSAFQLARDENATIQQVWESVAQLICVKC